MNVQQVKARSTCAQSGSGLPVRLPPTGHLVRVKEEHSLRSPDSLNRMS